jgi:nitrate reductase alpha subunit
MIENKVRYQITIIKLKEFEQQLAALDPQEPNLHPRQIIGWRNSFNLTIRQLKQEIAEYEQHLEGTKDIELTIN